MTANEKYVLDANIFIDAAHHYYAFDLAPGFWTSLVAHAKSGEIQSIDRVKHELDRGNDNLAQWADRDFGGAFASTDDANVVEVVH